jgi:PPOX class probable F420-dependent enzyme
MLETRPEAAALLDEEQVGWLTTVTPSGQPQSSIVWFLRDGDDLLIYSQAEAGKLANIAASPRVAFNLRSDPNGDEFLTIEATATVDRSPPPANEVPAYVAKYEPAIQRLGWAPPEFAQEYPVLIRLKVTRLRYWKG